MKKLTAIILCFVILMTLPVSCGKKDKMSDYPFSLAGVKFTQRPQKVVSLSPSFLEIIYYMQLNGNIAGRSEDCLVEAAQNRPTFGTQSEPRHGKADFGENRSRALRYRFARGGDGGAFECGR